MKKSELKQLIKLIITESKAFSGFKETKDSSEHTEKVAKSKSLTSTSKPVEKEEGKKLPVKDKSSKTETDHVVAKKNTPQPPAGEKTDGKKLPVGGHGATKDGGMKPNGLKEDILGMIREALEAHRANEGEVNEMAKKAIAYDGKTLTGSISNSLRKQDAKSPTGWSLVSDYKMKDGKTVPAGTPVDAPSNTGKNYVKKGIAGMGRPKAGATPVAPSGDDEELGDDEGPAPSTNPPSKVNVVLDGKKLGTFDFRLPSGKISSDDMETQLYRIEDLAGHALDDSVAKKYAELEDAFFDDKLQNGASLNLKTQRGPKGLTAVAV